MVNITQNVSHMSTPGPIAPALLTGSWLFDLIQERPVLPYPEHYAIMGFPVHSEQFPWEETFMLRRVLDATHRRVTGNGMHLSQIGCWLAFALAIAQPR